MNTPYNVDTYTGFSMCTLLCVLEVNSSVTSTTNLCSSQNYTLLQCGVVITHKHTRMYKHLNTFLPWSTSNKFVHDQSAFYYICSCAYTQILLSYSTLKEKWFESKENDLRYTICWYRCRNECKKQRETICMWENFCCRHLSI